MSWDTLVIGGRAVLPERGVVECDIAIVGGSLASAENTRVAAEVSDATSSGRRDASWPSACRAGGGARQC